MKKIFLAFLLALSLVISCLPIASGAESEYEITFSDERALPMDMGESLLSGMLPVYTDYSPGGKVAVKREYFYAKTELTDGDASSSWFKSDAYFADYNYGNIMYYKNGEAYCDIIFRLKKLTDISGIAVIHHNNKALVTSRFECYASDSFSSLFLEKNKIASVYNPDAKYRQIIKTKKNGVSFFALRFINPVGPGENSVKQVTASKNNWYPRMNELCLYGEERGEVLSANLENLSDKTEVRDSCEYKDILDFESSELFGALQSIKYCKSGTIADGKGGSATLTDGNVASSWYTTSLKFAEKVGSDTVLHIDEEDFYVDIIFDAGKSFPLGLFYVRNHRNEDLMTGHYRIYASKDKAKLGTPNSMIADCYNHVAAEEQYFFPNEKIEARYFLIRVLNPCFNYASKLLKGEAAAINAYPRFNEFAAFSHEGISGKLSFGNLAIFGDYVCNIQKGTKVKTLINSYKGRGDLVIKDKQGNIKMPSEKLSPGDKLAADTGYGADIAEAIFSFDADSNGAYTVSDAVSIRSALLDKKNHPRGFAAGDVDLSGSVTVSELISSIEAINKGVPEIEDNSPLPTFGAEYGAKAEGIRGIAVDTNNVINDNFLGFGVNSFSATLTDEGMEAMSFDRTYHELNKKRLKSLSPNVSRIWFQIDWMITNEETDLSIENIENNKDYLNYKNGIYDFDNKFMDAFVEYIGMLKDIDCEVEINFGWKTATRLKDWFVLPCLDYTVGAPKDLDAFGDAAAALLKYLREEKGLTNVKYLASYNEPNGRDFQLTEADEMSYWSAMIKKIAAAVDSAGLSDEVKIWGPEVAGSENDPAKAWTAYQAENTKETVDMWTIHHYYDVTNRIDNYSRAFDTFRYYRELTNEPCMVTEMYANTSDEGYRSWFNWNDSTSGYFIANANAGMSGMLSWSAVGGYLPEPLFMKLLEKNDCSWELPSSEETANKVKRVFYEQSLFGNYIPRGSKVLYTDWIGNDIRATAFSLPDGGKTVIVESNGYFSRSALDSGKKMPKDIKITFADKETVEFNRFSYIAETQVIDANATVCPLDKTMTAQNGVLTDSLGGNYGVYVYTTLPPIKQISLEKPFIHLRAGESAQIIAELIDCAETDEAEYSITEFTNEAGSITENGVFTASDKAQSGDKTAVRISLKNNPEIFAVAIIFID